MALGTPCLQEIGADLVNLGGLRSCTVTAIGSKMHLYGLSCGRCWFNQGVGRSDERGNPVEVVSNVELRHPLQWELPAAALQPGAGLEAGSHACASGTVGEVK